jgi:hypothetical protein
MWKPPRFDFYKDPPGWKLAALALLCSPGILYALSYVVAAWK